jgi:excisionase family DNA binding protein
MFEHLGMRPSACRGGLVLRNDGTPRRRSRKAPMHPHVLDAEGVAVLVRSSPAAVRRWAHDGEIPGTRVGGQWRFWAPAVLERVIGAEPARSAVPALPDGHTEPGVVASGELADLLGLPDRTVTMLMRQGRIPGEKVGGQWRSYWPWIRQRIAAGLPLADESAVRSARSKHQPRQQHSA